MSTREIVVLVENLTESDFVLSGRYVEEGCPQVILPSVIQRAAKLRWSVDYGSLSVAAEFESVGDSDGNGAGRVLVVGVVFPAPEDWLPTAVSWLAGGLSSKPHFWASIEERPKGKGRKTDYRRLLAGTHVLSGHMNAPGVEWMPVQVMADELEIRLRLLPALPPEPVREDPAPALARSPTSMLRAAEGRDEVEVRRLEGYRKIVRSLNKQAALMELQADTEPMNLSRLRDLPEKVRVDLLLLVLGTLLARRQKVLEAWQTSTREEQPALRKSVTAGRELMRNLTSTFKDIRSSVTGADQEKLEEQQQLGEILADHAEHVHQALGPLMGFDQGEKRQKIAALVDTYIRQPPGCEPQLPDLQELCASIRTAVEDAGQAQQQTPRHSASKCSSPSTRSPSKSSSLAQVLSPSAGSSGSLPHGGSNPSFAILPPFSKELCWPVGNEHFAARYVRRVTFLDMDLCPTTETAVDRLNFESRTCHESCCLAYLPHAGCYGVLYREGRRQEALEQLGVKSEEELQSNEELPRRISWTEEELLHGRHSGGGVHSSDDLVTGCPPNPADGFAAEEDASSRKPAPIPRLWLAARDLLAMLLGAGDGAFDARSRAAYLELCVHLGVPPRLVVRWEAEIGGALFEALETSNIVAKQNESQKGWNRGKVALAASGGGILLAVTGGLAAPALAAAASAIGTTAVTAGAAIGLAQAGAAVGVVLAGWGAALSSLGTAGAAVLFGATGAGITGWKLSRRWADLEEFHFTPLARNTRLVHASVEISDAATISRLDHLMHKGGHLPEDMVVKNAVGTPVALPKGTRLVRSGYLPHASAAQPRRYAEGGEEPSPADRRLLVERSVVSLPPSSLRPMPSGSIVKYEFEREVDKIQRAVHLAIFVSGWLTDEMDITTPWADAARLFFPSSGHLALRWETKQLLELGSVFGSLVAQEVASSTASFWLKTSAVGAAGATSLAAMTVAWPVWIISAMANLDNTWLVSIERARVAGKCLAHALADRQTVGQRPVTLVGHSIGARLLVYCLLELHRMGEFHAVDDVVLLGTPVTTRESKWQKVRAVVSGRVVNGYLGSDWVLAFLYRYLEWGMSVAGLSEVNVPGVENVDLSGIGIAGHHDYPRHILDIMARMRIGERRAPAS